MLTAFFSQPLCCWTGQQHSSAVKVQTVEPWTNKSNKGGIELFSSWNTIWVLMMMCTCTKQMICFFIKHSLDCAISHYVKAYYSHITLSKFLSSRQKFWTSSRARKQIQKPHPRIYAHHKILIAFGDVERAKMFKKFKSSEWGRKVFVWMGFSHTIISRVYREWSEKEKISSKLQLSG